MKTYIVPVVWTMRGNMFVKAKSEKEALEKVKNLDYIDVLSVDRISEYEVVEKPEVYK